MDVWAILLPVQSSKERGGETGEVGEGVAYHDAALVMVLRPRASHAATAMEHEDDLVLIF